MRRHASDTRIARVTVVKSDWVEHRIFTLRGSPVLLDADLAALFGVATRVLNQAVRRNRRRFPADFLFTLTPREVAGLRSQIVISNGAHGGRRYLPYAFTEHGTIMLATVLNSPIAVSASIHVVRAFVRLRSRSVTQHELVRRLEGLESKCDKQFGAVFRAIRQLLAEAGPEERRRIGFGDSNAPQAIDGIFGDMAKRIAGRPWPSRRVVITMRPESKARRRRSAS